jgi:hypothetical protein
MIGRIAAAAFLLSAAATPAAADATSEALVRDFVAWVDSSDTWAATIASVRSDGSDTIAEGFIFSLKDPNVSINIERVRLADLAAPAEGGFKASEIEMTSGSALINIAQPTGPSTLEYSIPSAAVWNISMPSLAGVEFDPARLMSSFSHFYSLAAEGSFDELSIPEMSSTQRQTAPGATEPVEIKVVYRNNSATEMADGVLRHQEAGPITIIGGPSASAEFEFTIDKAEADRIDIGAFARIFDASAYRDGRGDNIWRPVVSRVAYGKMTGRGEDGVTFGLDEIAVENVDGRQPEQPFTEMWDRLMDPSVPQDVKADLALDAVTAMMAAWRVGTVRVDGISVEAPKENASFSLESFSMTGWSSAGLDSLILKKLEGSGPEGFLSLGSFEIAGFIAPDLKALVQFAALEKNGDPTQHAEAIRQTFAALPRLAHFGLHDISIGKSEADSGSLANFTMDFADWNDIYAGATDVRLDNLSIPRRLLELDQPTTEIFDTLGYDTLTLGMSVSDRWNPDNGTDDATWTFSLKDAADLELTYSLTGLTIDWLMRATAAAGASEDQNAAMMEMVSELGVASARLSVTDRSLLDRGFGVAAQKQGLTIDGAAYREQMRAALPFIISAAVPAEVAKLVTAPLQAFLGGGQKLLAIMAPPTPIKIPDLMQAADNPTALPSLLNMTLTTEPAAQ